MRIQNGLLVIAAMACSVSASSASAQTQCVGAEHTPIGNSTLTCDAGGLVVSGPDGSDLIRPVDGMGYRTVEVQLGWPIVAWPSTQSLQASTTFSNGASSCPVTWGFVHSNGTTHLSSNLSSLAPTSTTVWLYNGNQLVAFANVVGEVSATCGPFPSALAADAQPQASGPWGPQWAAVVTWKWSSPGTITIGDATYIADRMHAVTHNVSLSPQRHLEEIALDSDLMPHFSVHQVTFGDLMPCQLDLGYASDPTARISLCGGDLSTGNDATYELTGGQPSSTTLLFVGLSSTPTNVWELNGSVLVPLPSLFVLDLPTDSMGEHAFTIPGGGGPATFYLQEVILGPNTVTNALEVNILP